MLNLELNQSFISLERFKKSLQEPKRFRPYQLLADRLVRLFVKSWNKRPEDARMSGFYLDTNNLALAHSKNFNRTPRTVRNGIIRLIELGFLEKSETTGRGIRLWISPQVLIKSDEVDMKKIHSLVLEPLQNERKEELVDKSSNGENKAFVSTSAIEVRPSHLLMETTKNPKNIELAEQIDGGAVDGSKLLACARSFWNSVRPALYPDHDFGVYHEKKILNALCDYFKDAMFDTGLELYSCYQRQIRHLEIAAKWFQNHPEVRPPDPVYYFNVSPDRKAMKFCNIESWSLRTEKAKRIRASRLFILKEAKLYRKVKISISHPDLIERHTNILQAIGIPELLNWYMRVTHKIYLR